MSAFVNVSTEQSLRSFHNGLYYKRIVLPKSFLSRHCTTSDVIRHLLRSFFFFLIHFVITR